MLFSHLISTRLALCVLAAAAVSTGASAQLIDAKVCQQTYVAAVTACAHGLQFLEPNTRVGAQKACVQTAQANRDVCLNGVSPAVCLANCQSTYNSTVAQCEAAHNPDNCPAGDTICVVLTQAARTNCIGQAVDALQQCTAACPTQ